MLASHQSIRRVSLKTSALIALVIGTSSIASASTTATVTVDPATVLSTIPSTAAGINTAVWDGDLLDSAVPSLMESAGIKAMRYPGGSTADLYAWSTNSIVPGQTSYANPNNDFDAFMGVAKASGVTPIITVNYGSNTAGNGGGTPAYAASWVTYANVTKSYGVKYWEIGNEVYGNGEYDGVQWETDLHSAHDPTSYGTNVAAFASAMKAADSSIKVGAVLAAPGNWPEGQSPDWNSNVLAQCGSSIDFVIVHWYPESPGSESDSALLAAPQDGIGGSGIAAMVSSLKSLITQYCGSNAPNVQMFITETNSVSSNPGKQMNSLVNAMFIADDIMTWLEGGISNVDVWDLHNGSNDGNDSSSLYGTSTFGDYGILSNATSGEPAVDTPFPTYYGMQMLTHLGKAGDSMVSSSSSNSLLSVHAVKQANGDLALMFVNKDLNNTDTASVSLTGYTPGSSATVYTYGKTSSAITSSTISNAASSFSVSVAPYSLTTVVLTPGGSPPAAPTITSITVEP